MPDRRGIKIDPNTLRYGEFGSCGHNLGWTIANTWERKGGCPLCREKLVDRVIELLKESRETVNTSLRLALEALEQFDVEAGEQLKK